VASVLGILSLVISLRQSWAATPGLLSVLTLLLLSLLAFDPALAREEETGLPIIDSGTATADLDSRRVPIRYSMTIAGPLVQVRPLIDALGGELRVGPLGESHELSLNDRSYAFGPPSDALTFDEEIVNLSQAAIRGPAGAEVPLDLLDNIYGHQLGYEFSWNAGARSLMVRNRPARELDMEFNLVHVQGVTTVVFQFPVRPRYRLRESGNTVVVELVGDRLGAHTAKPTPNDELVRNIGLATNGIRLRLAPGTVAEDYVLEDPFRLVFDVFRGSQRASSDDTTSPAAPPNLRRQRTSGIRTIVLDPGHGGSDTGAISSSGLEEKRLTLQLARLVKEMLERRLPVRVVLTRDRDGELPLEARAALANQYKGDLFVSLHLNSAHGSSANGAETYFLSLEATDEAAAMAASAENGGTRNGDPLFDLQLLLWDLAQSQHLARSQTLAKLIQEELNLTLELRNRGVKQAPFRVLMGVAMPAVLVEFGFLSNPSEESKLQDPEYRLSLAEALVDAISRYRAGVQGIPEGREEAVR
jgi:N-acetylmuramoyl-L-alanine amidase